MSSGIQKAKTNLSSAPTSSEVKAATEQLVEANHEGVETCDDLDLFIKAAETMSRTTSKFRGKVNYARSLLMDIALKL